MMVETTIGDGYACGICGQFVSWGQTHTCPGGIRVVNTPHYQIDNIARIAEALEKIADALDKISKQMRV